jgi:hypothetical protein
MRGRNLSTVRDRKARLTSPRSLVWTGDHMQDLAAEAPVAQERRHIVMPREAPMAILFPFEDRHRLAQLMISGIGIVEEIRIARIEADAAACSVDLHMHAILPGT